MVATAASDHPFDWEGHLRPLCIQCSSHYWVFSVLLFGHKVRKFIDLVYYPPPSIAEYQSPAVHAQKLRSKLTRKSMQPWVISLANKRISMTRWSMESLSN